MTHTKSSRVFSRCIDMPMDGALNDSSSGVTIPRGLINSIPATTSAEGQMQGGGGVEGAVGFPPHLPHPTKEPQNTTDNNRRQNLSAATMTAPLRGVGAPWHLVLENYYSYRVSKSA